MTCDLWSFLRLRPGNFPHVRLAQLAWLYHKEQSLFSRVMAAETPEDVKKILSAQTQLIGKSISLLKRLRLTGKNGWGRMPWTLFLSTPSYLFFILTECIRQTRSFVNVLPVSLKRWKRRIIMLPAYGAVQGCPSIQRRTRKHCFSSKRSTVTRKIACIAVSDMSI